MLTSPFQCDYCWFFNITKRVARDIFNSDAGLLAYIRRVNLDLFWSREPSTVANTMRALSKAKTLSDELGLPPVQLTVGPWPVVDTCGFQIAIEILKSSQRPGRNDSTYTQFDSIRKLRSAYLTIYDSSPARCLENGCLKNDRGQISYFIDSPTQSRLFTMFMHGCEKRMGRMVKQDMGLSFDMLTSLLKLYEEELVEEGMTEERKRMIVLCAGAFTVLFAGTLRGGEVFMLEVSFRQGATTRAKEMGVSEPTIDMNNRWRLVQNKKGGLPNLPMTQLYVEITQALTTKLRFSKSL